MIATANCASVKPCAPRRSAPFRRQPSIPASVKSASVRLAELTEVGPVEKAH